MIQNRKIYFISMFMGIVSFLGIFIGDNLDCNEIYDLSLAIFGS